jgi:hypothetical protein
MSTLEQTELSPPRVEAAHEMFLGVLGVLGGEELPLQR